MTLVEQAVQVLETLGPVLGKLPHGTLTDDEKRGLETAEAVLKLGGLVAGNVPEFAVVQALVSAIPMRQLVELAMLWRHLAVKAETLDVRVENLGPDVEVRTGAADDGLVR